MDIQYLSDPKGIISGVFIPLAEWQRLKQQYHIQEEAQPESGAKLQKGLREALQQANVTPTDED